MKLATLQIDGRPAAVLVEGSAAFPLNNLASRPEAHDVLSVIVNPLSNDEVAVLRTTKPIALEGARWLPPVLRPPKNVFCVGKNYVAHVEEGARAEGIATNIPSVPYWFTKPHTALTGHQSQVRCATSFSSQIDYEGELAVVIGKSARSVSSDQALSYVFGYTVLNDMTARDVQQRHGQWFKGKSADGFAPCGPWIATADEVGDPQSLSITVRVDGELRQRGRTSDMLFPVADLIADLSGGITLEPGDIIATGTPSGVGWGSGRFLKSGNTISVEIEKVGELLSRFSALENA